MKKKFSTGAIFNKTNYTRDYWLNKPYNLSQRIRMMQTCKIEALNIGV